MHLFYRFINRRRNTQLSFEEDVLKHSLFRSAFLLLSIIIAHVYLMTLFEEFNWQDALWLTLTTLSTSSLFVMANDDHSPTAEAIQQALANISQST